MPSDIVPELFALGMALASAEFGTKNSEKQRKTASFLAVFHDRKSRISAENGMRFADNSLPEPELCSKRT